jgi:hypothetical protein
VTAAPAAARRGRRTRREPAASAATREAMLRTELGIVQDNLELATRRLEEASRDGSSPFAAETREGGVADLERQVVVDPGWRVFAVLAEREFSAEGMVLLRQVCRLSAIANPMIKRGLGLRGFYVWGQGCQITARANGKNKDNPDEQDVQAVLAAHIADEGNQRAFWGQQAREENEHALGTDGEVVVTLHTKPLTGWVQVRTVLADEITEVICNPEDRGEPWFYRRVWALDGYDKAGNLRHGTAEVLYPDVDYKPAHQPATFAGVKIEWDTRVVHVPVNKPKGWLRGIPDAYAVINWARAYKEFLEQWAGLMRSLSKFAWKLTAEGKQRDQAKRAMAEATQARTRGGEEPVGSVAVTPLNGNLEAIPKSGATLDSESGRPLAMQVAAGLHLPVTMLLGDPGQTGARATAETLDWPTELGMMSRRELWKWAQLRISRHVITESVRAPRGILKGKIKRDPVTGREVVTLAGDTDDTVDVIWPPLDKQDPKAQIDAVVAAQGTNTIKPELVLRLLLDALGVREAEAILDEMLDDEGNFKWPSTGAAPALGPGQQAADLARTGGDPATAGDPGSMRADQPPGAPPGEQEPTMPTEAGVSAEAMARQADADFGLFGGKGAGDDAEAALDAADTGTPAPAGQDDTAEQDPAAAGETDEQDPDADDGAGDDEDDAGATPAGLYDPAFFKL